jgi:hypothetical protein
MNPDMARSCRFMMSALRSLMEGKQTCRGHAKIDANDPERNWQLLLAVHKSLGGADQIHSDVAGPFVVDGTGSTPECIELDR